MRKGVAKQSSAWVPFAGMELSHRLITALRGDIERRVAMKAGRVRMTCLGRTEDRSTDFRFYCDVYPTTVKNVAPILQAIFDAGHRRKLQIYGNSPDAVKEIESAYGAGLNFPTTGESALTELGTHDEIIFDRA